MRVRAAEVPVGFEVPCFGRTITREMARIHAAPMRNFHTLLEDARALGFPDLVIAGPMFACFYSEMFTRLFGEDWITSGELDFKLLKPVLANQTVTARAVVVAHEPRGGRVRIGLDVWCDRRDDGARTSAGRARVLVGP
jgi:hydroxyacyl-ACP dehydratase HTD2-like protein with hotdog domain